MTARKEMTVASEKALPSASTELWGVSGNNSKDRG
jgi:hypothetical protein